MESLTKYYWQFVRTNPNNSSLIVLSTGVSLKVCRMLPKAIQRDDVELALVRMDYLDNGQIARSLAVVRRRGAALMLPDTLDSLEGCKSYIVPQHYVDEFRNWSYPV